MTVKRESSQWEDRLWALDFEGLLLACGYLLHGDDAVMVHFPDVETPTQMGVSLYSRTGERLRRLTRCPVTVIPPVLCEATKERLGCVELAVFGDADDVCRVLRRSGVVFHRVEHRYALDYSESDILVIAPGVLEHESTELLQSLESRLSLGLHVVVLPQDVAWATNEVRQVRRPVNGSVTATGASTSFEGIAVSVCPEADWLWVIESAAGREGNPPFVPLMTVNGPTAVLAARVPIGEGGLWVLSVPQCQAVDREPEGLVVLDRVLRLAATDIGNREAKALEKE